MDFELCFVVSGLQEPPQMPGERGKRAWRAQISPSHSALDSFHLCCCLQAAMSTPGRRDGDLPSEGLGNHNSLPPPLPKPTKVGKAGLKCSVLLKVLLIESNSTPRGHG